MTAVRSQGMLPQPVRPEVRVIAVGFGALTFSGPRTGYLAKARIWLLAGATDAPEDSELAVYVPGPAPPGIGNGGISMNHPVRRSYGPAADVHIDGHRWQVTLASGTRAAVTLAPCGCGAGLLAQAGPVDTSYRIAMIRHPAWVHG